MNDAGRVHVCTRAPTQSCKLVRTYTCAHKLGRMHAKMNMHKHACLHASTKPAQEYSRSRNHEYRKARLRLVRRKVSRYMPKYICSQPVCPPTRLSHSLPDSNPPALPRIGHKITRHTISVHQLARVYTPRMPYAHACAHACANAGLAHDEAS